MFNGKKVWVKEKNLDEKPLKRASYLVRESYRDIGLTRELLILEGKLDPLLFQTINMLVKVPPTLNKFVILYHIQCKNCSSFSLRDMWYGQVIRVEH